MFGGSGTVQTLLASVGIAAPDFIHNPTWALWTLVLLALWQFGAPMVIFLAGLKQIPPELYAAAAMDGDTAGAAVLPRVPAAARGGRRASSKLIK
jgi:multiple sugar transport system permease protein